jgi:hypothetical protein
MGETTETEIKEEKTDKSSYIDVFAIFISIFGTVWCLSYGIVKLVNMEAFSAVFNILLGAVNGTCLIVNITSFIKRRFKIGQAY